VLNALARPVHGKLYWSLFRALFLGIISFGVAPILMWTKRFRQYVTLEQQQLWHLSEWITQRTDHAEASKLRAEADAIRPHSDLRLLIFLSVGLLGILFFTQLYDYRHHLGGALLNCTYLYPVNRMHIIAYYRYPLRTSLDFKLFNTWSMTLGAAYVFHWLQVQRHAATLKQFIQRFNAIAASEGLTPVQARMPGYGIHPLWLVAGLAMASLGILWGLPMMLAGSAHRRMLRIVSNANRAAIAHRLRAMLLARRPNDNVPLPVYLRRQCGNDHCRAPISDSAAFCPRCGARIAPGAHRVG
jgi:hypothetical protein